MSIRVMTLVWDSFPGSGSELIAMLALADWCNDEGASLHPSVSALGKKCRLSESQARRVLHGLIEEGYLHVVANWAGGAHGDTRHYRMDLVKLRTGVADARGSVDARGSAHDTPRVAPMRVTGSAHDTLTVKEPPKNRQENSANAEFVPGKPETVQKQAEIPKSKPQAPIAEIVALYHELMPDNPRCKVLNDARKRVIACRWREAAKLTCPPFGYENRAAGLAAWREFFSVCAESDFLTGKTKPQQGRPPFLADIDFLMSPSGLAKCLENKYHRETA